MEKTGVRCLKIERPDGTSKEFMFAVDENGYSKNLEWVANLAKNCNKHFGTDFKIIYSLTIVGAKQLFEENGLEMPDDDDVLVKEND